MITGNNFNPTAELLNDCNMTPFVGNISAIAAIERIEAIYSDTFKREIAKFNSVAKVDGTCTRYSKSGLYLVCPKGKR